MATTIAKYYTDELVEWVRLIVFYNREMDDFKLKLAEVIQRNTIPHIASKVEAHQDKLNAVSKKFYGLQTQIQKQEAALKTDSTFIDDTLINSETERKQNQLRRNMQQAEKEYIDIKYECYNFLSETLNKQND